MSNTDFTITKRKSWMIPTPFVLTDAVIIRQKVKPSTHSSLRTPRIALPSRRYTSPDSLNVVMDSLK